MSGAPSVYNGLYQRAPGKALRRVAFQGVMICDEPSLKMMRI